MGQRILPLGQHPFLHPSPREGGWKPGGVTLQSHGVCQLPPFKGLTWNPLGEGPPTSPSGGGRRGSQSCWCGGLFAITRLSPPPVSGWLLSGSLALVTSLGVTSVSSWVCRARAGLQSWLRPRARALLAGACPAAARPPSLRPAARVTAEGLPLDVVPKSIISPG